MRGKRSHVAVGLAFISVCTALGAVLFVLTDDRPEKIEEPVAVVSNAVERVDATEDAGQDVAEAASDEAVTTSEDGAGEALPDQTDYRAEIAALSVDAQKRVFLRAVQDSGFTCSEVTESDRMDDREGRPTWRAVCDEETLHIISIDRDGTANVLSPGRAN